MRRRKQLNVVLSTVSIVTLIVITKVYQQSPNTSNYRISEMKAATRAPTTVSATKLITKYDVILNSYMRSGSSLVGQILGFRNDTFYFYEPLWRSHGWHYHRGENTTCHYLRFQCKEERNRKAGSIDQDEMAPKLSRSDLIWIMLFANISERGARHDGASMPSKLTRDLAYLNSILDCSYPENATDFSHLRLLVRLGGPKWESVSMCLKKENVTSTECLEADVYKCKEASHRVSKVLRLTLDNLTPLLETRPNLKVIHLFRDPRGLLNSHFKTGWHPMARNRNPDVILQDVSSICDRMLYDVKAAKQLKRKFPGRFLVVQYEDLVDMLVKAGRIFDFVGMSYTQADRDRVDVLTRYSKRRTEFRDVFTAWRKSLSWEHVNLTDSICTDVYKELGYKAFVDEGAYMDPEIPSMEDPLPYAI